MGCLLYWMCLRLVFCVMLVSVRVLIVVITAFWICFWRSVWFDLRLDLVVWVLNVWFWVLLVQFALIRFVLMFNSGAWFCRFCSCCNSSCGFWFVDIWCLLFWMFWFCVGFLVALQFCWWICVVSCFVLVCCRFVFWDLIVARFGLLFDCGVVWFGLLVLVFVVL